MLPFASFLKYDRDAARSAMQQFLCFGPEVIYKNPSKNGVQCLKIKNFGHI